MTWRWQPIGGSWTESSLKSAGLLDTFADQASAEAWLTSFYDDLLDEGVAQVSLFDGDRLVYGPMSLEA